MVGADTQWWAKETRKNQARTHSPRIPDSQTYISHPSVPNPAIRFLDLKALGTVSFPKMINGLMRR